MLSIKKLREDIHQIKIIMEAYPGLIEKKDSSDHVITKKLKKLTSYFFKESPDDLATAKENLKVLIETLKYTLYCDICTLSINQIKFVEDGVVVKEKKGEIVLSRSFILALSSLRHHLNATNTLINQAIEVAAIDKEQSRLILDSYIEGYNILIGKVENFLIQKPFTQYTRYGTLDLTIDSRDLPGARFAQKSRASLG